ncbi:TatD family deoxyribonuclease [Bacillus aerolatus]|uniref:TatD family deoxyribonuclease n=1 Tax=Bacillus aerolatus TaxID=2653354 RepID=A0A6I1FRN3_9BACI|nr:TatD family hydrolase [Bacillus aerolatus]KAB7704686.1 TatD family deoxyribonuclease [Bacillus aerolatus]
MDHSIIDAHIHLDLYDADEQAFILRDMEKHGVQALISVSQHLSSARVNLTLSQKDNRIKPAFGFHPEQALPEEKELTNLKLFTEKHHAEMAAIGEVGLPYYLRKKDSSIPIEPYIEILEQFIQQAVALNKPIVLHAVYEDAPIVCTLLEKHSITKAHFHWFKGDRKTMEQMISNGYGVSITPDVLYEQEIQQLVKQYPLSHMMVETDGPWPFEGPFKKKMTHPKMIHHTIEKIASIKKMEAQEVYNILYENTKQFYF